MRRVKFAFALLVAVGACLAVSHAKAQSDDDISSLTRKIQQLYNAGEYRKAFVLQRSFTRKVEAAETGIAGKAGSKTADALGGLAWYGLFAREFDEALAATERARTLAPNLIWIETNRAHVLLFLGRLREARALYLRYRGQRIVQNNNTIWEEVIGEDFEAFRKAGLSRAVFKINRSSVRRLDPLGPPARRTFGTSLMCIG
jgi:tetratricopeptide (TPR) repeat protein